MPQGRRGREGPASAYSRIALLNKSFKLLDVVYSNNGSCSLVRLFEQRALACSTVSLFTQPKITKSFFFLQNTVLCNQMGTVLAELSSWTLLTWHLGMKKAF